MSRKCLFVRGEKEDEEQKHDFERICDKNYKSQKMIGDPFCYGVQENF